MKTKPDNSLKKKNRRGAAVVEFAVCLPLIVLIVFGSIEAASMLFLRQATVQSAYEGAKVAIQADATDADVQAAATQVIAGRQLSNVTISTIPASIDDLDPGTTIQVTVSAPGDENSMFPFGPFRNRQVSADAFMVKE